jgi:hypothetical protein
MYYPLAEKQVIANACMMKGVVYVTSGIEIYACQPTDEALKCLEHDDYVGASNCGAWGGRNLWIIQWEGSEGVGHALAYLNRFVGEGGCLAGIRHGKIEKWSKDLLNKRSAKWATFSEVH